MEIIVDEKWIRKNFHRQLINLPEINHSSYFMILAIALSVKESILILTNKKNLKIKSYLHYAN